jgi:hypothetical protein
MIEKEVEQLAEQTAEEKYHAGPPKRGHGAANWAPRGDMSHFILLTAVYNSEEEGLTNAILTYRIRADRIDWVAEREPQGKLRHSVVSVNGKEILVQEPVGEILQHIEDYTLPYLAEYRTCSTSSERFRETYGTLGGEYALAQDRLPY